MVMRVIDTETTGIDPSVDRVIEIASIDDPTLVNDFERPMSRLINPQRPIPPEASAVHHILADDVADSPTFREVIGDFIGADVYVAHNADFERGFLDEALGKPTWICTLKCALRAWPEAPGYSNQTLRYWRGIVNPLGRPRHDIVAHRALGDVLVTGALVVDLWRSITRDGAPDALEQMIAWSREPALYTRFTFGKYKGQRYDAVDPSYLRWIVDKSDLDAGVKFSAVYWLKAKAA